MEVYLEELKLKSKRKALIVFLAGALLLAALKLFNVEIAIATLCVLGFICLVFITDAVPATYTAIFTPLMLYLCGSITSAQVFSGFSNENLMIMLGMFVVGGAIFRTGAANAIGLIILEKSKNNVKLFLVLIMTIAILLSSVMSNTSCVAVLMPMCISISDIVGVERKKILLPLAFMASIGGTITLIGTPPNVAVSGFYEQAGFGSFKFFDFAFLGVPFSILGGTYMFFASGLLKVKFERKEYEAVKFDNRQKLSLLILIAVVVIMAAGILPNSIAAIFAAVACVILGLSPKETVLSDIDWQTIVMTGTLLTLSSALNNTGAGRMLADLAIKLMGGAPSSFAAISVLFIFSAMFTQVMSNTASAALLAPIGLQIAAVLNINPAGILMVVAFGASCAFLTPMATPPNLLIMGAGGMKFTDYAKVGFPLVILGYILSVTLIPVFWPF